MGTRALISPEEYLAAHYEYEPEYVCGELRERPMPDAIHAWIAGVLIGLMHTLRPNGGAVLPGVRCRMPNGNFRLPDVALFSPLTERVPTKPALAAIEVISDSEKHNELLEKLQDFEQWGVPHIWVVNPRFRTLQIFQDGALHNVDTLTIPEYGFQVRYEDLVAGLPADI